MTNPETPAQERTNDQSTNSYSVFTMPLPGTRNAPKKFKGKHSEIEQFLDIYDRLLLQNRVTDDKDKCTLLTQYCSSKVKSFIKALPSYIANDWGTLRADLMNLYDADLAITTYRQKDLLKFVKESRSKRIRNLTHWKRYCRRFIRIAGYLLHKQKINDSEHATYFWAGIPKDFRMILEARLLANEPSRDMSNPFKYDDIGKIAVAYLQRDKFPTMIIDSDESENDSNISDSSEDSTNSESSDVDSDLDRKKKRKEKKKKRIPSPKRKANKMADKLAAEKLAVQAEKEAMLADKLAAQKQDEVEGLIKQLNKMTVEDAEYGMTYYKAIKIDADIARCVKAPITVAPAMAPPRTSMAPYSARSTPQNNMPLPNQGQCFGCGEQGHSMSNCQKINELVAAGIVEREPGGR
ncbi:hypothetical protein PLICRDRAFT_107244, partial [Plicaturopsis crispa FD-325 SS-3]